MQLAGSVRVSKNFVLEVSQNRDIEYYKETKHFPLAGRSG